MPAPHPVSDSSGDDDALAALKQQFDSALEEANHYRHMMEMSTVLGAIGDFDGRFVAVTPGWRSVLGHSPERLVGSLYLSLVHSDDLSRARDQLQLLMSIGVETSNFEVRLRARDGSYRWIHWNLRGNPESRHIYGVGYDMTERRLVEEELIQAREAALQASHEKSRFLANISHEMRTPMNGILGMTALALTTALTGEQREYVQLAHQSGESLLAIINDILDISKIEARRISLTPVPFALRDLLDDVVESGKAQAQEKNLVVNVDVAPDAPLRLLGDVGRIGQILRNLVSNALKFTEAGWVHISVSREGPSIRFAVRDTGLGIPREQHQLIFEAFRQGDDSATRRHGGTGLGLSIARELTMMMGGLLWVESIVGEGATFHCLLPLPAASDESPGEDVRAVAARASTAPMTLHVLVAEDNPINARLATRSLQKLGCRVTVAETGRHVVNLVDANDGAFDVILMDVQMPDLDGLETTAALRRREQERGLPRLPIVALTANAMKGDEDRCLDAGMDGYLAKPVTLEQLEREIRRVTEGSPAHQ